LLVVVPLAVTLLNVQESSGANRRSHCSETLPITLDRVVKQRYPDWHLLSKKDHGLGCPGIAKVDFYGDGRSVYAFVIERYYGYGGKVDGKLVIAEKKDTEWELSILEEGVGAGLLWHEPAGKYTDVYGERELTSKDDVILYFGSESWSIVYAWTGAKIEKVWMSD
jgi:hypothetical protein